METKKDERSLAERVCGNQDPKIEKLKQAILNLKSFKGGFKDDSGMNEYQIQKALKDEQCMFLVEEELHMALMDLCNSSGLLRATLVYNEQIHKLVAHTYWPVKTASEGGFIEIPVKEIVKQTEEEKDETKLIEEPTDEKRESR